MSKLTHLLTCSILILSNILYLPASATGQSPAAPADGWSITSVDKVDLGSVVHFSYTSIAVDSANNAYVSYRGTNSDLRYATNGSGCWFYQIVQDAAPPIARDSAIALDPQNRPHISYSYSDYNAEDLKYATQQAGAWQIETVETTNSAGLENDIAIDNLGKIHISHWQYSGGWLNYSTNAAGSWTTEVISNAMWARTAIAIDPNGIVHIAYTILGGTVKYASKITGKWVIEVVDRSGSNPSLAIDNNGIAHLSYFGSSSLMYATNGSGSWATSAVADSDVGRDHAIFVDQANKVHISFYDPVNTSLKYANNVTGAWDVVTVDDSGDVGRSNAIAVDKNNFVHISYRSDTAPAMLKYATTAPPRPCFKVYMPMLQN